MRMRQVIEKTGLSEKAIRFYIREGLLTPETVSGDHYNHYSFSEEDVQRLKSISALRTIGRSIADIKDILTNPEKLPDYLRQSQKQAEEEINKQTQLYVLLSRLQPDEYADLSQFTRSFEPLARHRGEQLQRSKEALYILILFLVSLILYLGILHHVPYIAARLLLYKMLLLLFGVISCFMAVRYATVSLRAKKLPFRCTAEVRMVTKDTGFDASYAIGKSVSPGSGFFEQGQGGSWQWFFMLWNEIRPDHWFPVLQYQSDDGQRHGATFPYGGLKNSWKVGESIPVAWDSTDPGRVLPLKGSWLLKKAMLYFVFSIVFFSLGCLHLPRILNVITSPDVRWMKTVSEVLEGYPEIYEGEITQTDTQIQLLFTRFEGTQEFAVPLHSGDTIVIQIEDCSEMGTNDFIDSVKTISPEVTFSSYLQGHRDYRTDRLIKSTYTITEDSVFLISLTGRGSEGSIVIEFDSAQKEDFK